MFIDFTAPPFVNDVLVAGKDGFHSQNHWTIPGLRTKFQRGRGKALRSGQGMVIADQYGIGRTQGALEVFSGEDAFIRTKSLTEVPQIFSLPARIVGPDFTLHAEKRM
jgi:hypothetical protein